MALESSLNLVHYISIAMIIWLFMRYELTSQARSICSLLLIFAVVREFAYAYVLSLSYCIVCLQYALKLD